ncbi:MAG TPA: hypothetical protein VL128_11730 [Candidatus Eisenbacteria bacterium]|nr:hypothetical protein [Candidatus Eisenbacteria bacterium]
MARKKQVKKTKKKATTSGKTKRRAKKAKARPKPKMAAKKKPATRRPRGRANSAEVVGYQPKGLGALSGGQSGDLQGISEAGQADSESVEELLEEGQTFEAEAIAGVENAADPDVSEVVTHEIPEDDVPGEYREND